MEPNPFIKKLKEYPLASHKAWEFLDKEQVLKMDWNESDLSLPESVRKSVIEFVTAGQTHWYPDIANQRLVASIASYVGISPDCVQYFAGEDSALDYAVRTFVAPGDRVGIVAPTYDNFRVYVESVGAVPELMINEDPFTSDIEGLISRIDAGMKMVYLVNPNNPTGALYTPEDIAQLLSTFKETLFIIDEAYYEFAGVTVAPLIASFNNLIVGRSFSKAFGLASFRLGYLLTSPENLTHINKIRNGKSVGAFAQIAAIEALKDTSFVTHYVEEMKSARAYTRDELIRLSFNVRETPGNFILIFTPDSKKFKTELEKRGVFVRDLGHLPHMEGFTRVTVGNMESAKKFIGHIEELLSHGSIIAK